jgi:pimeloyl-ACP methyl ester carboxylesterase
VERVTPLAFGGFKYECRVLVRPDPVLAPILLLGGAFQDKFSWLRHEATIGARASVVTVDLPGWGAADRLPSGYGLDFLADALHHMIVELGLPPLNVMGGSYGGVVAYRLAQRHPADVRRLVLCGTALHIPQATRSRAQHTVELVRAGDMDRFVRSTLSLFLCQDPERDVLRRRSIARLLERQLRALTPDEAHKYVDNTERVLASALPAGPPPTCRTLVVTGEHDCLTTAELCRAMAARCPDARFAAVRQADHLLPLERPDEFVDLLLRFYTDQPVDALPYVIGAPPMS